MVQDDEAGTHTTVDEAEIMQRLATFHARSDNQAGEAHLYRLMESLANRGNLPEAAWEVYRTVYEGRRSLVGSA